MLGEARGDAHAVGVFAFEADEGGEGEAEGVVGAVAEADAVVLEVGGGAADGDGVEVDVGGVVGAEVGGPEADHGAAGVAEHAGPAVFHAEAGGGFHGADGVEHDVSGQDVGGVGGLHAFVVGDEEGVAVVGGDGRVPHGDEATAVPFGVEVGVGEAGLAADAEGVDEVVEDDDFAVLGEVGGFDEDGGGVGGVVEGVAGGEDQLGGIAAGDEEGGQFAAADEFAVGFVDVMGPGDVEEGVQHGGRQGSSGIGCIRVDESYRERECPCCGEEPSSQTLHSCVLVPLCVWSDGLGRGGVDKSSRRHTICQSHTCNTFNNSNNNRKACAGCLVHH